MKTRDLFIVTSTIVLVLLAAGVAGARPNRVFSSPAAAAVSSTITYQGRLTNPDGERVNGARTMRFIVYDDAAAGAALWDSGDLEVTVEDGLFTVQLDVDSAGFNGQARWLSILVEGETLSPRQEILPAPYALSLRPGADIVGDAIEAGDAALAGYAPATGAAVHAEAGGGAALSGDSENNYGVWGSSSESWGGYFTSEGGYGLRVETAGTDHYDHGAYITSASGYGVYAQSANNQAVRGEAGDVTGIAQPLGPVGVVGMGANRGVYGASGSGVGVYANSQSNYAGYFYGEGYRALYASSPSGYYAGYFTNRGGSTEPGLYVNGNIMGTGSKSGYVVDICVNAGPDALEVGDVVAVVGVSEPVVGEIPVMRVVKAGEENAGAVVGVVDQRFILEDVGLADVHLEDAGHEDTGHLAGAGRESAAPLVRPDTTDALHAAGTGIQPGEYLSVVTLGAFKQVKVDASYGALQPGDLLTPSPNPGYAMRASDVTPGAIVGKALAPLETGQGSLPVYVTVQ